MLYCLLEHTWVDLGGVARVLTPFALVVLESLEKGIHKWTMVDGIHSKGERVGIG